MLWSQVSYFSHPNDFSDPRGILNTTAGLLFGNPGHLSWMSTVAGVISSVARLSFLLLLPFRAADGRSFMLKPGVFSRWFWRVLVAGCHRLSMLSPLVLFSFCFCFFLCSGSDLSKKPPEEGDYQVGGNNGIACSDVHWSQCPFGRPCCIVDGASYLLVAWLSCDKAMLRDFLKDLGWPHIWCIFSGISVLVFEIVKIWLLDWTNPSVCCIFGLQQTCRKWSGAFRRPKKKSRNGNSLLSWPLDVCFHRYCYYESGCIPGVASGHFTWPLLWLCSLRSSESTAHWRFQASLGTKMGTSPHRSIEQIQQLICFRIMLQSKQYVIGNDRESWWILYLYPKVPSC